MTNNDRSVTLCGEKLSNVRHICGFFDSRDEQFATMMPFLQEGLDEGEQAIMIFESENHPMVYNAMQRSGMPVEQAERDGQLKLLAAEGTYIKDSSFAADRMYETVENLVSGAQESPYPGVRACGDMVWALRNIGGTDELMIYETRLNFLVPKYSCTLLCMYDLNRFSGKAIADILASHSHVIMNGRIHVNQHYVEPMKLLQELLHRKKRPLARDETMFDSFQAAGYGPHTHDHVPALSEAAAAVIA